MPLSTGCPWGCEVQVFPAPPSPPHPEATYPPCRPASKTLIVGETRPEVQRSRWAPLFSHSVVSDPLRPRGLQPARLPALHCLPELLRLTSVNSLMDFVDLKLI